MERRAVLRHFSVLGIGMPILQPKGLIFNANLKWRSWLQALVNYCDLEKVPELFYTGVLPKEELPGFSKAIHAYYFYEKRTCCFTVLEKYNLNAGLLELAVPIWKQQENGSWKKLACLSLFELEALAKVTEQWAKTGQNEIGAYLLPSGAKKMDEESFTTIRGALAVQTKVGENGVQISIRIRKRQNVILQTEFKSEHLLTAQI